MQTQSLYTYRPLVYRRRDSMAEFFEESPLWEVLYQRLYLPLKKKWYFMDVSALHEPVEVFNEAYALMVQALADGHPETDFEERYARSVRRRMAGDVPLCWALVCALTLKSAFTQRTEHVAEVFCGLAVKELGHSWPDVADFLMRIHCEYSIDYKPHPERPERLCDPDWWMEVTDGYDPDKMEDVMSFWKNLKERERARLHMNHFFRAALSGGKITGGSSLSEENARLKDENARLAARVAQLEQQLAERDNVQRLPLSDFLTHVEQLFTHEQNPSALIVKDVLFALYTNPTAEERSRLNKLGHLPPPPPFGSITVQGPLNDIHGNEHVKAGL